MLSGRWRESELINERTTREQHVFEPCDEIGRFRQAARGEPLRRSKEVPHLYPRPTEAQRSAVGHPHQGLPRRETDALVPDPTEKHDVSDRFATVVSVQRSGAPLSADLPVVVSSSGRQFIRASYVTTK